MLSVIPVLFFLGAPAYGQTVSFTQSSYDVGEGDGMVTLVLESDELIDSDIEATYFITLQSANQDDLPAAEPFDGTVTLPANQQSVEFSIAIEDDSDIEGPETFLVEVLAFEDGFSIDTSAVVTILDDDELLVSPTVSFSQLSYEAVEGSGFVTLLVQSDTAAASPVDIGYEIAFVSADGSDINSSLLDSVELPAGQASVEISIEILDDSVIEGPEIFEVLLLEDFTDATVGSPSSAVVTIVDDDELALPTISFSQSSYEAVEGTGVVTLVVESDTAADTAVDIAYEIEFVSADSSDVNSSLLDSVELPAGQTSVEIFIEIVDDSEIESVETFEVLLPEDFNEATVGSPSNAVVTIIDDDELVLPTISFSQTTYEGTEGSDAAPGVVTLELVSDIALIEDVTVSYVLEAGTADETDIESFIGSVELSAGSTSTELTIELTGDAEPEGTETFEINLDAGSGFELGAPSNAVVTILDDDEELAVPTISLSASTYEGTEGSEATPGVVTLELVSDIALTENVTVTYALEAGTADETDIESISGSVELSAGSTSTEFTIDLIGDAEPEGTETFEIILDTDTAFELGEPSNAVVTILDDDEELAVPTISLSESTYEGTEGSEVAPGVVTLELVSDIALTEDVTVTYVLEAGTADETDVESISGSVELSAGSTLTEFTIALTGDAEPEGTEKFEIFLDSDAAFELGQPSSAVVTILDDDEALTLTPVQGDFVVSPLAGIQGNEDDIGSFDITISRSILDPLTQAAAPATVRFNALGSIPVESDSDNYFSNELLISSSDSSFFSTGNDSLSAFSLSWEAGEVGSKVVSFTVVADDKPEPGGVTDLDIRFTAFDEFLFASDGGGSGSNPSELGSFRLTVIDDDTVQEQPSIISLASSTGNVNEGESLQLEVTRSGGEAVFQGEGSVSFTVLSAPSSSAEGGADFVEITNGVLNFPAGSSSQFIDVQALNDAIFAEGIEQVIVTLSDPEPEGSIELGQVQATVDIIDITNPGELALTQSAVTISEDDTEVSFTVIRTEPAEGPLAVNFATTDGTAMSPEDYLAVSGTLSFADGQTSQTFSVVIVQSSDVGDEQFSVAISGAPDGVTIAMAQSIVTIVDTSMPGTFSLVSNTFNVQESQQQIGIPVSRAGADGSATVTFSINSGSAIESEDFSLMSPVDGVLQFQDGETEKTILINISDDNQIESDEQFTVNLTNVSQGAQIGGDATATVTITDTSDAGQILFSQDVFTTSEGDGAAVITVTRSAVNGGSVNGSAMVNFQASGLTATAGADFDAASGVLQWADGETGDRTFTVTVLADDLIEGTETISLTLSNPQPEVLLLDEPVTLELTDSTVADDVVLSYGDDIDITVDEAAGTLSIPIIRSGDTQSRVTLSVQVGVEGDTASADDYSVESNQIVWEAGVGGEQSIEIVIENDDLVEPLIETFTVQLTEAIAEWPDGLTNPPNVPDVQLPVADTIVSITDDEPRPLLNDDGTPVDPVYVLEIVSGDNQSVVDLPQILLPLQVRAMSPDENNNQPVPGVEVVWAIVPDPRAPNTLVAEFIDQNGVVLGQTTTTVGGVDGETQVSVNVLRRGFIGVRVSPMINVTEQLAKRSVRALEPPVVPTTAGDAVFTIRAGLEPTQNLTRNESEVARAIDIACDALDEGGQATDNSPAAQGFAGLCDLAEESPEDIQQALSRVLPEEVFTLGDSVLSLSNIQVTNVSSRIQTVRSGLGGGVDASGLSVRLFGESIPGSVVGAIVNNFTSGGNAGDDLGLIPNWGFFVNGAASFGSADGTENEIGQDFDTRGITAGADYRFNSELVLGAALGFTNHSSSFSQNGGISDLDGSYLSLFGTWYKEAGGYIDGVLDFGHNSFDIRRRIDLGITTDNPLLAGNGNAQFADGDTNASSVAVTVGAGWDFNVRGTTVGPYGRLSITAADVDAYSERAVDPTLPSAGFVLNVRSHRVLSANLSLGGQASRAFSTKYGVFIPQVRLEVQMETEDRPDGITATFQQDPTGTAFSLEGDRNDTAVVNYGLGGSAVFPNGKSAFLFFEGQAGHDTITQNSVKGGFRLEF